jgi:hypothetical protein
MIFGVRLSLDEMNGSNQSPALDAATLIKTTLE